MSSASSAVTYTSIYTDSEPGRVFWGADEELSDGGSPRVIVYGYDGLPMRPVAPPSPDYIPGPEEPHTPPVPQDEDEREPMFIQPYDLDYVPEPMYPEYIPLEDEHVLSAEEEPLPPVESPGYVAESDPEEYEDDESKDGLVDYPMDGGDDEDDDDDDSSGDDADDEDEDEEDEKDEEEEHLAPADSAIVIPTTSSHAYSTIITTYFAITTLGRESLARCTTPSACPSPPPIPSPLLPSSGCPTQIQTLRMASTQALIDAVTTALPSPPLYIPPPVDRRDDILETKMLPRKSTLDVEARRRGIREVRYGIRDTWVDPVETVPEITPMTVGEVNTKVTKLAELHEHDTQDLYALLEDAQDSKTHISQRVTMDSQRADLLIEDRTADIC
nr:hypothetical protein [Tanacetum cinerariifolium]